MVRTGYLHFALGIELVGVSGYVGMTPVLLWEQDYYRFEHDWQETFSGYRVLCGAFKGQPNHQILRRTAYLDSPTLTYK